ncbi:MAG: phage head closure protein [Rickettsiales bacterium]
MKKDITSRLRYRITLQQDMGVADGAGGYTENWQDVAVLWAEIVPAGNKLKGREKFFAGQIQSENMYRITIRHRDGIANNMRIIFAGKMFNIKSVVSFNEIDGTMEILAEEGVAI